MNKHRNLLINAGQIKSGHKPAAIGSIPTDWEVVKFEDAILRKRIKIGKVKQQEYKKVGKYPVIDQSQNFIAGYTDEENKLYQGDLPVIIFGDHTRVFKYVDIPFVAGADGVKVILPDKVKCHPSFLYYALLNVKIKSRGYNRHYPILREKKIPIPPLPEQQKIAKVLSVIQEAIEQQDKIIEATRKLKKSLMHNLFTEGLDGEEQKETEIGRVPKSWEVVGLGEDNILTSTQYGLSLRGSTEGKYPILRMSNLTNGYVNPSDLQFVNVDETTFCKFRLERGDILFNRTNSVELVGKTSIFNLDGEFVFASYLIRLKTNPDSLNPYFLNFYLNWDTTQSRLKGLASRGVSQANISATRLKTLEIPLPSLEEQQQIAHILSTVDKKIVIEERRKATLKELFKTMLHKLMTGEIRVKDVEI